MKEKVRSFLALVLVLQILLIFGQMEGFVILNKLDKASQSNAIILIDHSSKLAKHDQQFDAILDGTFTREFADKIRGNLNAQR